AITGIAVDKGLVKLDQPILSFFPKEAPPNPDPLKQKITVANMLSMQSGLDCGVKPGEQELAQMRQTNTWVKFTLALPMVTEPGSKFAYCSPGYHVLSSIVTAATHQPEVDFGRKYLFDPLGIKDVVWPPDDEGRTHGWGDSHFYPRDFGKIGYLYLHDGIWDGKQIISKEWIRNSITKQADPGRRNGGGYGYGWWLANTAGMEEFGGNGRGGQMVAVWPEKDIIVIATGGGYPATAVGSEVAKSIVADKPVPANAESLKELREKIAAAAKAPAPTPTPDLPSMAKTVSGNNYALDPNTSRLEGLTLTFKGNSEAQLKLRYLGTDLAMPVGLDGVYRLGPYGPLKLLAGATGKWTSDTDFLLDINFISNINRYTVAIHFEDGQIQTTINESSGLMRNGKVTGKKI
ncbi:MAG: 6-aminohexanoate-dimer hydrolase, partial [Bryobacterales bacterium]|nr:6-aminohexanoate-dimer hydrolase [Bryobacterales bacterium]